MWQMRAVTIILLLALACVVGPVRGLADEVKRPVVFVPGILGSRLCDSQERVVWGSRNSLGNLSQLELDVPANPVLHPCGLVDAIQILGSLWTHNTYKSWIAGLADIGFSPEKKNLFLFAYDWRLSNFDNAKRLDAFVTTNTGSGKPFDIVAHSMGGIVSRIYLNDYTSAKSVQQIIYLGTPFLGSMNAFGTIKEGWGWPFDALAGGQDVVARVSLSFPGMLELLPRYDDCCYIRKSDNSRKPLDIFDPQTWRSLGWLPAAYTAPERFERFAEALKRSNGLTSLLTQPAPPGVYEIIFASDVHDTLRLLGMKEGATTPSNWVFTSSKAMALCRSGASRDE
jgi:pimeloyl-ACP methyl ester carboxylesterase